MQAPTSVLEILDTKNISYSLTAPGIASCLLASCKGETCFVESVLLQDAHGRVQVLIPSGYIVDLDAIYRQFDRDFDGVPDKQIQDLVSAQELSSLPAIPKWQGLQTLIDSRLLKNNKIWLKSGHPDQIIEINQVDFQSMIDAANVGEIAIEAPVLDVDPSSEESRKARSMEHFTQRRIRQRLDEVLELPPLPETAQRIIKLRADPNADICDLVNIVEIDPSLAAQVVSWAASPYYSAPGKIKSVHDAIVRVLGFDMVLNLALGLALGRTITETEMTETQIAAYWRESAYIAASVEGLVTSISRENRPSFGMSYLAGLLSNFGYLVTAQVFPPYFASINRLCAANPHISRPVIEQHSLGVSGNQIAAWLLENWNMPEEVVTALRQQYNSQYKGNFNVYAKLIYVARQILAQKGFGQMMGSPLDTNIYTELHLDQEAAELTVENILESGDDLDAIADKMRA